MQTRHLVRRVSLYCLLLPLLSILLTACGSTEDRPMSRREVNDLPRILERGKLIAITDYNSTNYFLYRGQPMGYQYELLQDLADYLDTELEVIVSNDLEETFNYLLTGYCDLIAINLTVTRERKTKFDFTVPHSQTRQVLVQRKPAGWKNGLFDERSRRPCSHRSG